MSRQTSQAFRGKHGASHGGNGANPLGQNPRTAADAGNVLDSLREIPFPSMADRPRKILYKEAFRNQGRNYPAGVYYHGIEERKQLSGSIIELPEDYWFLSVLEVVAITRTESGNEHAYLIEYVPHGETEIRRAILPQAALLGRAEEALKTLRDLGVSVLGKHCKLAREYLDEQHLGFGASNPSKFWHKVSVTGWHDNQSCFVLPGEIIGRDSGVWFDGKESNYGTAGDLATWKAEVPSLCDKNPYLQFALSCAFTGPLLELLNIQGIGFHFFGDSTSGKTTALLMAASAWGSPKFALQWRATSNGLEIHARNRSDTLLILDESNEASPGVIDAAIYLLINGRSKARMNRDTSAREVHQWRICTLSSGEKSLESHLAALNIDAKAGQGVRIIGLPVSGQHGLFDDLHGSEKGGLFSDRLRNTSATNYGSAGPGFVRKLIERLPKLSLRQDLDTIVSFFGDDLNSQETRVARAMAIVTLAGELAIEFGILPWPVGSVNLASFRIFRNWRETQPKTAKSKEHMQVLERILDCIQKHGDARFSNINWTPSPNKFGGFTEEPIIRDRLGYWDDSNESRIYLFTSGGLREAVSGLDHTRVLRALDEAAAFTTRKGAKGERSATRETPDGRKIRFYHVDPEKLVGA